MWPAGGLACLEKKNSSSLFFFSISPFYSWTSLIQCCIINIMKHGHTSQRKPKKDNNFTQKPPSETFLQSFNSLLSKLGRHEAMWTANQNMNAKFSRCKLCHCFLLCNILHQKCFYCSNIWCKNILPLKAKTKKGEKYCWVFSLLIWTTMIFE